MSVKTPARGLNEEKSTRGRNSEAWAGITGTKDGGVPRDDHQREAITSPGTEGVKWGQRGHYLERTREGLADKSCGHKVGETVWLREQRE